MSDVDVIIKVHTQGVQEIGNLSASLRNLNNTLRGINVPMSKLDANTRAVHKALGITSRGVDQHAKSIKQLVQNQKVLGSETKKIAADLNNLKNAYALAGKETTALGRSIGQTTKELSAFSRTFRGMRLRAIGSDISNISLRLTKMGKDAQFVGRSLLINLSLPLAAFARVGLQNFVAIEKEMTRLTKVMEDIAPTLDIAREKMGDFQGSLVVANYKAQQMVDNFNALDKRITELSLGFGVSKDLVASLSADFAELGITSRENITNLTELTLQIEKLGGMDIGPAQDLAQALYFQSKRALEINGALDKLTNARQREARAVEASITQLQLFNAIENATALTLRDLGQAFPEIASMATSYGLSMTEAAALLAPMKAAGLDIGASANSIKVSLQRALAPTKQNIDMLQKLAKQYGVSGNAQDDFMLSTKSGLVGLGAIVKLFDKVINSSAGMEGALKLMSDLFEKRQGPRMFLAIEQFANFNNELQKTNNFLGQVPRYTMPAEVQLALVAERTSEGFQNFNSTVVPKTIRSFEDIGRIARIATSYAGAKIELEPGKEVELTAEDVKNARLVREEVSKYVIQAKQAQGIDIISEVKSEAGRALMIQLAGGANAAQVAQQELDRTLATTGASLDKIRVAFKLFASDIIRRLTPAIESLSKKIVEMYEKWMSEDFAATRERIINLITSLATFLATMGPVILALGTMQSVFGNLGRGLSVFIPKLRTANGEFVGLGNSVQIAGEKLASFYKNTINKAKTTDLALTPSVPKGAGASLPGIPFNRQKIIDDIVKDELAKTGATPSEIKKARQQLRAGTSGRLTPQGTLVRGTGGRMLSRGTSAALKVLEAAGEEGTGLGPGGMSADPTMRRIFKRTRRTIDRARDISRISPFLEAAGVATDEMGTKFLRGGKEITEKQARGLATGGISAARARIGIATTGIRAGISQGVESVTGLRQRLIQAGTPGLGAKGTMQALAPNMFANATKGIKDLESKLDILTGQAPNKMQKIGAAIKGVAGSLNIATKGAKIFRIALMFSGIGAIIAGIAAVVFLVIKNLDKIKGAKKGWDALKTAFNTVKDAVMEIIRPIQDLFAYFGSGSSEADKAGNAIASAFTGIAVAIKFVAGLFKTFVEKVIQPYLYGIVNIVIAVVQMFKGNWGEAFKFLIAGVAGIVKGVINLFVGLGVTIVKIIAGAIGAVLNAFGKIPFIGKAFQLAKAGVDGLANAASGMLSKIGSGATGLLDKAVDLGLKKSANKVAADKKVPKEAQNLGSKAGEAMANSFGDADWEGAGDKAKAGLKKSFEDVVQRLQDYVAGRLAEALKKFASDSVKSLNKQKEAALKVFDIQINTLMKLEKAEESLTRKKQYELNRRKILDDASLRQEVYRRNRALAIYEGRIDDARVLDLEERQSQKESAQELQNLDDERRKDLAKENLEALREAINQAKELAGKFFDESVEKFQNAAENIMRVAPVTQEQYAEQLEQLRALTTSYADSNNLEFGKMFEQFSTTIAEKMPNTVDDFGKALGGFTVPLDELVTLAMNKYGLGSEWDNTVLGVTSKMADSVIGITLGMLVDIGDAFGEGAPQVVERFGEVTGGLKGNLETFKTDGLSIFTTLLSEVKNQFIEPFKKALDEADPVAVFKKAIIDGNLEILRSFQNMVDLNPDLMKRLGDSLDPAIKKYLALKAAIEAAANAASGAGDAGGGIGDLDGDGVPDGEDPAEWRRFMRIKAGIDPRSPVFRRDAMGRTGFGYSARFTSADAARRAVRRAAEGFTQPLGLATGGYLDAPASKAIPAILHGGEFVLNAASVRKIGVNTLMRMNNYKVPQFKLGGLVGAPSTFRAPVSNVSGVSAPVVNNVSTVNIQVENFIGEEEWFESMMRSYNINVAPQNRKLAGLESRRFSSYNGINQGM